MKARQARFKIKIPLVLRVVSLYILFGAASTLGLALTKAPAAAPVAQAPAPQFIIAKQPKFKGKPVSIVVPRLGINLAIVDGTYNTGTDSWTLTDDKAQFATMTDQPNDLRGNTFIYGHNTDQVFAKLSSLGAGDVAQVVTQNGHTFNYIYSDQQSVQPNNTAILNDKPTSPRLTLMTCEGIFSQTRRIMYFNLKDVS